MIKKLLEKIRGVTENYVTINCEFSTNTTDNKERKKVDDKVEWRLYIADLTCKSGNAFPSFPSFEELERYVNILCLELKRVDITAIERAIEVAEEICREQKGEK